MECELSTEAGEVYQNIMFLTQWNSDTDFTLSQGEHPGWIRMHQHETCHNGVTRTVLKCMLLTYRTADVTLHGMRVMEHVSCITPCFGQASLLRTKWWKRFVVAATSYTVFDRLLVRI